MNRRDFMKFAGVSWFSLFLPKGLQMATYTELMMKIADGQTLDAIEREQLRQYAGEMESNNKLVSSWQNIGKKINSMFLDLPINIIQSTILAKDEPYLEVLIPSDYKHLLIIGAGKSANASTDVINAIFNNDTGSNYSSQAFQGVSSTPYAAQALGTARFPIAGLSSATDEAASFFAIIPHYQSSFFKTAITLSTLRNSTARSSCLFTGYWDNESAINRIKFTTSSGSDIKAGSVFSIYGIK